MTILFSDYCKQHQLNFATTYKWCRRNNVTLTKEGGRLYIAANTKPPKKRPGSRTVFSVHVRPATEVAIRNKAHDLGVAPGTYLGQLIEKVVSNG